MPDGRPGDAASGTALRELAALALRLCGPSDDIAQSRGCIVGGCCRKKLRGTGNEAPVYFFIFFYFFFGLGCCEKLLRRSVCCAQRRFETLLLSLLWIHAQVIKV